MVRRRIPQVVNDQLVLFNADETANGSIPIGSPAWFAWIRDKNNTSFALTSAHGSITFRREQQRHGYYWYAYRWYEKKLHKAYIGKSEELTHQRLFSLMNLPSEEEQTNQSSVMLKISFLGSPTLVRHSQPIEKLSRKALLLLAYLAMHSKPQTRERVMTLLWAESSEEAARKNLRNMLWHIRAVLGEQVVQAQGNASLSLEKRLVIDIWAFEQEIAHADASFARKETLSLNHYEKALTLYHGIFLDGITVEDSSEMHLWLILERERLSQMVLRILLILIEAARGDANWSIVLTLAQRALLEDSLHEPIYRFQMEAFARLGERSQALHLYDTLRTMLEYELGVQPLPETEALRMTILRGELEPFKREYISSLSSSGTSSAHHSSFALSMPFVGRKSEWALLDTELQLAAHGQFRIMLLMGEIGIGKSRLWQEWSTMLTSPKRQATIVEMHALEVTQTAPFAPLLLWFNQSPWSQQLFSPSSLLSPALQGEILRLLPTLQVQRSDLPYLPVQSKEAERLRIFEAVTQVLLAIQKYENIPLVLFLDDAHWSDTMTIQWFAYLAERVCSIPFLLILAYRSEEMASVLTTQVAYWRYQGVARHLLLPRLSEEEAQALMRNAGKDTLERHYLYNQSVGNPYVLRELLRVPSGNVPASLSDLVRTHLTHLSEIARQVVQAAAILEPGIDAETLRRTCGRSEGEMLDALDTLIQAGFLLERKGHYAFVHPLVATIVRENLGGARRAVLHRRAAEACERMTVEQLPLIARQLVIHYHEAGKQEQAAHYADIAAAHARAMTDWEEAIRLCLQARMLAPTPARTLQLGQMLFEKGDTKEAQAIFTTAFHEYHVQENQRGAARACLNVAISALKNVHFDEVSSWIQQALNIFTREDDPEGLAFAHVLLSSMLQMTGHLQEAKEHQAEGTRLIKVHNLPGVTGNQILSVIDPNFVRNTNQ